MMIIKNTIYNKEQFHDTDLYFFALGYEQRSFYLFDLIEQKLNSLNTVVFVFDDYEEYDYLQTKLNEIQKLNCETMVVNYIDQPSVQEKIVDTVVGAISRNDSVKIHIDYSSMPRSWYCKLPLLLQSVLREDDTVCFWYSEGEYPEFYEEYPSAGIDSFSFFSGKPSLNTDNNRVHILALSYDVIRTEAIISIVDPSYLVACYAYNPERKRVQEKIKEVNDHLLARSALSLALHIDDFSFMISKLCDTANELLPTGDIIFIPDGPKPLIFAISLIPDLLNKQGITCLHVARNSRHFKPMNVIPTETIYGFSVIVDQI